MATKRPPSPVPRSTHQEQHVQKYTRSPSPTESSLPPLSLPLSSASHTCPSPGCGTLFPTTHLLELHLTERHDPLVAARQGRGEKTFRCFDPSCDKVCADPAKRRRHLIDKHGYPRDFNFRVVVDGVRGRTSWLRHGPGGVANGGGSGRGKTRIDPRGRGRGGEDTTGRGTEPGRGRGRGRGVLTLPVRTAPASNAHANASSMDTQASTTDTARKRGKNDSSQSSDDSDSDSDSGDSKVDADSDSEASADDDNNDAEDDSDSSDSDDPKAEQEAKENEPDDPANALARSLARLRFVPRSVVGRRPLQEQSRRSERRASRRATMGEKGSEEEDKAAKGKEREKKEKDRGTRDEAAKNKEKAKDTDQGRKAKGRKGR